jgi:hypothetical protein
VILVAATAHIAPEIAAIIIPEKPASTGAKPVTRVREYSAYLSNKRESRPNLLMRGAPFSPRPVATIGTRAKYALSVCPMRLPRAFPPGARADLSLLSLVPFETAGAGERSTCF